MPDKDFRIIGAVRHITGVLSDDLGNVLTVKYAPIDVATLGDNTIVALVAGKKLRVINWVAVVSAAVSIRWKSGAATNLSGAMALAANGGAAPGEAAHGHFETAAGVALVLNLSAAQQVSGYLAYVEV